MKTEANISGITATATHKWFGKTGSKEVFVKSPCVCTEEPHTLRIGDVYEVHVLKSENGGVKVGYVKLLWVYLKGMTFHIIAVDIQSSELIHMSQRLGSDNPCDFIIADVLYYDYEDLTTKILRGKISVYDGFVCARASTQEELGSRLDELVLMVLDYGLHDHS